MSKIIIINGLPNSGKDTLVEYIKTELEQNKISVFNVHASDPAKEALKILGWDGEKTPEIRKKLADLVVYSKQAFDGVYKYLESMVDKLPQKSVLFIHERAIDNITLYNNCFKIDCNLLVLRDEAVSYDNVADQGILAYTHCYDSIITNNGTKEDLKQKAISMAKNLQAALREEE